MRVTLVDSTQSPEIVIGHAAAICYDADTEDFACVKRARQCKDKGHLATMRFAYATVKIEGISRVCSHQLVRVAHAGILQRSQRYCRETNIKFVQPDAFQHVPIPLQQRIDALETEARELYGEMITQGVRKEDARYILPQSCTTELVVTMNFQGWQDWLKNRADKAAQWEIREVALEVRYLLRMIAPGLFL